MLSTSVGVLGGPRKRPPQKEAEGVTRKVHLTAQGTASPSIFGQKKKRLKRKIKREHKQLCDSWGAGSELAGAAGVALQEAHDGRVALGPSDELFQGQLSISVGVHLAEDLFCPFLWG